MQVAADGIEYDVDSRLCSDPKPSMVEACNNVPCPAEWVAQPFGQVSILSYDANDNEIDLQFLIGKRSLSVKHIKE